LIDLVSSSLVREVARFGGDVSPLSIRRPTSAEAQIREMSFLDRVYQRARDTRPRIVFPEGDDPRVQEAASASRRKGGVVEVCRRAPDSRCRFSPPPALASSDSISHGCFPAEALEHPLTRGACLVGIGAADVMSGRGVSERDTIRPRCGGGHGARDRDGVGRVLHGGRAGNAC